MSDDDIKEAAKLIVDEIASIRYCKFCELEVSKATQLVAQAFINKGLTPIIAHPSCWEARKNVN